MGAGDRTMPSTMDAVIEVQELVTQYGARRVLDGVSLRVPTGQITVILGGSGCGKSTLLRHLIGLQRPNSGRILVKGRDITPLDGEQLVELRKHMGILFQSGALFNSMTVGENVALPLREHTRLEESTIQIMTRIKLQLVGLSGFEDFMPALPFFQPAGQTSPFSSLNCRASTMRSISSMSRPSGRSLTT